jgi:hypothetical protein
MSEKNKSLLKLFLTVGIYGSIPFSVYYGYFSCITGGLSIAQSLGFSSNFIGYSAAAIIALMLLIFVSFLVMGGYSIFPAFIESKYTGETKETEGYIFSNVKCLFLCVLDCCVLCLLFFYFGV